MHARTRGPLLPSPMGAAPNQVFTRMKVSATGLEDVLKAAQQYHKLMEQVNLAADIFVDTLSKVGVGRTRGALGLSQLPSVFLFTR